MTQSTGSTNPTNPLKYMPLGAADLSEADQFDEMVQSYEEVVTSPTNHVVKINKKNEIKTEKYKNWFLAGVAALWYNITHRNGQALTGKNAVQYMRQRAMNGSVRYITLLRNDVAKVAISGQKALTGGGGDQSSISNLQARLYKTRRSTERLSVSLIGQQGLSKDDLDGIQTSVDRLENTSNQLHALIEKFTQSQSLTDSVDDLKLAMNECRNVLNFLDDPQNNMIDRTVAQDLRTKVNDRLADILQRYEQIGPKQQKAKLQEMIAQNQAKIQQAKVQIVEAVAPREGHQRNVAAFASVCKTRSNAPLFVILGEACRYFDMKASEEKTKLATKLQSLLFAQKIYVDPVIFQNRTDFVKLLMQEVDKAQTKVQTGLDKLQASPIYLVHDLLGVSFEDDLGKQIQAIPEKIEVQDKTARADIKQWSNAINIGVQTLAQRLSELAQSAPSDEDRKLYNFRRDALLQAGKMLPIDFETAQLTGQERSIPETIQQLHNVLHAMLAASVNYRGEVDDQFSNIFEGIAGRLSSVDQTAVQTHTADEEQIESALLFALDDLRGRWKNGIEQLKLEKQRLNDLKSYEQFFYDNFGNNLKALEAQKEAVKKQLVQAESMPAAMRKEIKKANQTYLDILDIIIDFKKQSGALPGKKLEIQQLMKDLDLAKKTMTGYTTVDALRMSEHLERVSEEELNRQIADWTTGARGLNAQEEHIRKLDRFIDIFHAHEANGQLISGALAQMDGIRTE